jgi:hypothetical protein
VKIPRWIRRRLGPSRAVLRSDIGDLSAEIATLEARLAERAVLVGALDQRLARSNAERDELRLRAKAAEKQVSHIQREVINKFSLGEPGPSENCTKIRLHTQAEALMFAKHLADEIGTDPTVFGVYRCKTCPRHPATTDRFWHIGNIDQKSKETDFERRGRQQWMAKRDGRTIGQMVTPEVMTRLRKVQ